eukprot:COSAG01_NODE_3399_length_6142_cov_11.969236_2_plen_296_part_00
MQNHRFCFLLGFPMDVTVRADLRVLVWCRVAAVDGQSSPQGQGTGTEEWGLGGDYWQGGEVSRLALGGHPNSKTAAVQSMYRWLLADAIPFGCSMRLSIEHGGCNMVEQEYEAVTVFYAREGAQLSRTDRITIMDPRSEAEHHYIGSSSSAAAQRAYRLSSGWVGASPARDSTSCMTTNNTIPCGCTAANPSETPIVSVGVREVLNSSSMTLQLTPTLGSGGKTASNVPRACQQVLLRRTMDYECFNQQGTREWRTNHMPEPASHPVSSGLTLHMLVLPVSQHVCWWTVRRPGCG